MNNNINLLLMHFLCNWMSTFNSFTSSNVAHAQSTNNNSNRENTTPQTNDNPDISNEDTNSHSIDTQAGNSSNGKRKRNSKKIPPKRSKRLSEMALKNGKMSQETDVVAPIPPKRMKRPKSGEVNNEFEVENLQNTQNKVADDDWLDVVPRKIDFQVNKFNHFRIPQTPKRLSKYMRKVRLSKLSKL